MSWRIVDIHLQIRRLLTDQVILQPCGRNISTWHSAPYHQRNLSLDKSSEDCGLPCYADAMSRPLARISRSLGRRRSIIALVKPLLSADPPDRAEISSSAHEATRKQRSLGVFGVRQDEQFQVLFVHQNTADQVHRPALAQRDTAQDRTASIHQGKLWREYLPQRVRPADSAISVLLDGHWLS